MFTVMEQAVFAEDGETNRHLQIKAFDHLA